MKRFTIVFLLVIFSNTRSLPQSPYQFSDIFFLDDHNGWILSTNDYLWKTTNAGTDWIAIYNSQIDTAGKIFFIDEQNGWMLLNTTLLYSSDGGENWSFKYEFSSFLGTYDISFITQSAGFISNAYNLYKTTNSGNDWILLSDTLGSISKISAYSANLIFISSNNSLAHLYKSTDSGINWTVSNEFGSLDPNFFGKVQMLTDNTGILSFSYSTFIFISKLLKTTNAGNSWDEFGNGFEFLFGITDFEFDSENNGYVSTNNRFIYKTSNDGLSWDSLQSPPTLSTAIENIEFFNPNISFGINQNHIYKTTDGWATYSIVDSIITDVNELQNLPTEYVLGQNYPNPFNPSTKIKYTIPSNVKGEMSNVVIKVFDVLGNEVATLINEEKTAGTYEVEFQSTVSSHQLASGIYYYQLRVGEYIQTKKMVLLK